MGCGASKKVLPEDAPPPVAKVVTPTIGHTRVAPDDGVAGGDVAKSQQQVPEEEHEEERQTEAEAEVKDTETKEEDVGGAPDVVGPGSGCSCVTVAEGLNPDGSRKDPQTCWDRTRDHARLMTAVKSKDEAGLEKVLRRIHTERASLLREGVFAADKRKLNLGMMIMPPNP